MLKKLTQVAAMALCAFGLLTQPAFADDCCYDDCNWLCQDWVVSADWIYWKLRGTQTDFSSTFSNSNFTGKVHDVGEDYDSGFRISVFKGCDSLDFGFNYTYFNTNDSHKASGAGVLLIDHIASAGAAYSSSYAKQKFEYNSVEFLVSTRMAFGDCSCVRLFAGPKFTFIDQQFNTQFNGLVSTTDYSLYEKNKLSIDAYGATFGAQLDWRFSDCMTFFTSASWDTYIVDWSKKRTNSQTLGTVNTELDSVKSSHTKGMSTLNVAAGISYHLDMFCCTPVAVSLGYELHQWINYEANALYFPNKGRDAGYLQLDGLFLRVAAQF